MRFARIRYLAAFLASSAFAAMPYVFQFGAHIQLYCLFLWPLSLLFCLKLAESRSPSWLFALSAVLALTFYLSMSLAIKQFFFVCLALLLSLSFVEGGSLWYWFCSRWRNQLFGARYWSHYFVAVTQQYIQVRRVHPFVRDVQD